VAASQHSPEYIAHINSAAWKAKRGPALERAEHRCQVCNADKHLDVHHRTYERLGNEKPGDLTVLCRTCHELFHGTLKLKRQAKPKKKRQPRKKKKGPRLKPCEICGRMTSKQRCKPCRRQTVSRARKQYSSEVKPVVLTHIADRGLGEPPMQRIKRD
jgi:hypothetical protein